MPSRSASICDHLGIGRVVHTCDAIVVDGRHRHAHRSRATRLLGAILVLLALPATATASTNSLGTYGTLTAGQAIVSPDGHYELVMQGDGNLVEYIVGGRALWSSNTGGDTGAHAVMQAGGNLVVYDSSGAAVWSSNSRSTGCPGLFLQSDGNAVIYSPRSIWATNTLQSMMEPGDLLRPGWSIYSPNEEFLLIMQGDGNLVLYDGAGKALWSSGSAGHPGAYAAMQTDGNLVVYAGHALWASGTSSDHGAHLYMQSDGNLVLYSGSTAVWSTATSGKGTGGSVAPKAPPAVTTCPPPPPPSPPPPPPPVVTTPVSTPIPPPVTPHALAVRLNISWTWDHAVTRLTRARIGSFPGRAQIFVQCLGPACPGKRDISARGARNVRRLLRRLSGNHYRAGDRLLIILKAPGYLPERALVKIRDGRLPKMIRLPA